MKATLKKLAYLFVIAFALVLVTNQVSKGYARDINNEHKIQDVLAVHQAQIVRLVLDRTKVRQDITDINNKLTN